MLIVTTSENYYYKWKKLPRDISQCFTNQSMIIELDVSCDLSESNVTCICNMHM